MLQRGVATAAAADTTVKTATFRRSVRAAAVAVAATVAVGASTSLVPEIGCA